MIEVRDRYGGAVVRQATVPNSIMSFAPHIAILLTSLLLSFGMITLTKEIRISSMFDLII
jgi:hypothetical protein